MRKLFALMAVGAIATLGASAQAAPLASATLSFAIGTLPPAVFAASGATGTATSNLNATLGAGTAFNGTVTTTIPLTAAPPLTQIQVQLTGNGALAFTGGPASAAFTGIANVKGFGGLTLLGVPLLVGSPNTTTKSAFGVNITAISGAWTLGPATITLGPASPTVTAMATGNNGLTANGAGTLVLVTPVKIITNIAGTLAAFGVLTLTYVPEPGTLLLLGSGVAGLAALGRRRMS